MQDYSIILPTYRRPENFSEHIKWLLNLEPEPEEILVTHVNNNKWTDRFNFRKVVGENNKVRLKRYDDDPGLIGTKFEPAWGLDTDFVFTCDDDVYPGKKFPKNVLESYKEQPGIYGCMGFIYSETSFKKEVHGGWRGFSNHPYIHTDDIQLVDSPGQGYFYNTSDFPQITPNTFEQFCNFCSDDLQLAYHAYQHDVECFVPPEPDDEPHMWPVYNLKEQDLHSQSLVGGSHPDTPHKNELVEYIQSQDYVRSELR